MIFLRPHGQVIHHIQYFSLFSWGNAKPIRENVLPSLKNHNSSQILERYNPYIERDDLIHKIEILFYTNLMKFQPNFIISIWQKSSLYSKVILLVIFLLFLNHYIFNMTVLQIVEDKVSAQDIVKVNSHVKIILPLILEELVCSPGAKKVVKKSFIKHTWQKL